MSVDSKDFLTWKDRYSVGISSIDEQHKDLVQMLNRLHKTMVLKRGKLAMRVIIYHLVEHTKTHFLHEEKLMQAANYPGLDIHKKNHENLIIEIQKLQRDVDYENLTMTFDLLNFIKSWLINHITNSDKPLGVYLKKNSALAKNLDLSGETPKIVKKRWWKFW